MSLPPTRLPVLIFDFGNVVAHFDYTRACAPLAARLGLDAGELLERIRASGLDPLVVEHECGRISGEQFGRSLAALAGLEGLTHAEFVAAWRPIFWLNEPVVHLAAGLKRLGYTLLLGSNTNALHAEFWREKFAGALAPFDAMVLSYEVGHMKPDPAFYAACARAAGVPAASCAFIDDLPENVAGARAVGMAGLLYRDAATLAAELARLGVELPGP